MQYILEFEEFINEKMRIWKIDNNEYLVATSDNVLYSLIRSTSTSKIFLLKPHKVKAGPKYQPGKGKFLKDIPNEIKTKVFQLNKKHK